MTLRELTKETAALMGHRQYYDNVYGVMLHCVIRGLVVSENDPDDYRDQVWRAV